MTAPDVWSRRIDEATTKRAILVIFMMTTDLGRMAWKGGQSLGADRSPCMARPDHLLLASTIRPGIHVED